MIVGYTSHAETGLDLATDWRNRDEYRGLNGMGQPAECLRNDETTPTETHLPRS